MVVNERNAPKLPVFDFLPLGEVNEPTMSRSGEYKVVPLLMHLDKEQEVL